jgi:hypothetical protein
MQSLRNGIAGEMITNEIVVWISSRRVSEQSFTPLLLSFACSGGAAMALAQSPNVIAEWQYPRFAGSPDRPPAGGLGTTFKPCD